MPASAADPTPKSLAARIAVWTASLLAFAGLIDAATTVLTKTESVTCGIGISLPWCGRGTRTIADFTGEWINKNPAAGITRISIDQRLDEAIVHAWGACHPTDCDWGTAQTKASGANYGSLRVKWDHGFSTTNAILTFGEENRLEIRIKDHFTDNSGRPDYESVDYLVRK
jgi:hypothetical protein